MGISVVGAQAESGSNDFTLNIGTSGNTTFALDKTYPSGRYEVDFINNDSTYDIYAVTAAGSYVGYTNSTSIDITQDFRTIVVLGAANNEKITFTFSGPIATAGTKGDVVGAAAFLTEVVTAALPDIDDTTVVNGGNFATDVEISFIGQDTNETNAKSVVRSSSTQLVVTRPDSFSPAQSPYTLKALNPGIPAPTGTNSHLLSNAVTAGTSPAWVTGTTIYYNVGGATNITLVAEDTEASDVDYSITSGTLPTGLSLNSETGVISGTFSGSASEGDVTSITVRATDAGGNYVDRTFSLTANTAPTWTTPAGALDPSPSATAYSFQLVASTGTAGGVLTYSLQAGELPLGLSLSSSGLISGTNSELTPQTDTFTVRVTDEGGLFADREFSIQSTFENAWFIESSNNTTANWQATAISPDGNYYASLLVVTNFQAVITLFNRDGSRVWARETGLYTAYDDRMAIAVDNSQNVYAAVTQYNGYYPYIWKIDASGTTVWKRRIETGTSTAFAAKSISYDSNYVYFFGEYYYPNDSGSGYASRQVVYAKLLVTDGSVQSIWSDRFSDQPANNREDYVTGGFSYEYGGQRKYITAIDQYYDFGKWGAAFMHAREGVREWNRRFSTSTANAFSAIGAPVSYGDHIYAGLRETYTLGAFRAALTKLNISNGAVQWTKLISNSGDIHGIAVDSATGYIWVTFLDQSGSNNSIGLVAFDVNGDIALSRNISQSGVNLLPFSQNSSLQIKDDNLYVIFRSGAYPITLKMPVDGSKVGTFTVSSAFQPSINITIATGSYFLTTSTMPTTTYTMENGRSPSTNDTSVPNLGTSTLLTYTKTEI